MKKAAVYINKVFMQLKNLI